MGWTCKPHHVVTQSITIFAVVIQLTFFGCVKSNSRASISARLGLKCISHCNCENSVLCEKYTTARISKHADHKRIS